MIRWITASLGTAPFQEGVRVEGVEVVDVRDLVDRAGNEATTIRGHVDAARAALLRNQRVLICCDHGISRSNAVATAVLAAEAGLSFEAALSQVLAAAGQPEIRIEVLVEVREACFGPRETPGNGARRVLLTGGNGQLGRLLLGTAPAGFEVWAPGRDELDLQAGPAVIEAYLRRHGIGRVMHYAQPHATNLNRSLGDALAMLRNLLDAAVANAATVLLPSNWLVFAGHPGTELTATDTTPLRPETGLGDTKFLCEQLLAQYTLRESLATTVLRSGPVVGAGIAPVFVRNLCQLASSNAGLRTHRYDNGRPALDFLSADDYAAAAWGLLVSGHTGTFQAGGGALTSTHRVAELIIAALGSGSHLSETPVHGSTCNVRLDSTSLTTVTGWQPGTGVERAVALFAQDPEPRAGHAPTWGTRA